MIKVHFPVYCNCLHTVGSLVATKFYEAKKVSIVTTVQLREAGEAVDVF